MKRFIDYHLNEWRKESGFKPLLLRGARQVGKTHAVRQLANQFDSFIELNLEADTRIVNLFGSDLDPERIVRDIFYLTGKKVVPGETLLFFDEVQVEPRSILALRYFYEKMPNLHVIAAGSLLDFAIEQVGVPVGRVEFMYMYPMSFLEFLVATGEQILVSAFMENNIERPISAVAHERLLKLLTEYLAIGGMPEVVSSWLQGKDPYRCFKIQQRLVDAYRQDFGKYSKKTQIKYLNALFEFIPRQLGRKFKYSSIPGDYRKRELEPCVDLLATARVINKVYHTDAQGIPLGAQADLNEFKLVFVDIALAQAMLGMDISEWLLNPEQQLVNKGEVVEAFVGQEFLAYSDPAINKQLYYWFRSERTSQAEIDYVEYIDRNIIPIEVKGGDGSTLKSMHIFLNSHPGSPYGIRFSTQNYSVYEKIHSYPLYAIAAVALRDKNVLNSLL